MATIIDLTANDETLVDEAGEASPLHYYISGGVPAGMTADIDSATGELTITATQPGTLRYGATRPTAGAFVASVVDVNITVTDAPPTLKGETTIETQADDAEIALGESTSATATVTVVTEGGDQPTGTVTFELFGPDDFGCDEPPIFTSTRPLPDNLTVTSESFTPTEPGTYRWMAEYSGDENYDGAARGCNHAGASVVVTDDAEGGGGGGGGDRAGTTTTDGSETTTTTMKTARRVANCPTPERRRTGACC